MLPAVDMVLKGMVVLTAAAGAAYLLRRRSAATRYLVWSTGLAALLALPVLGASLPAWTSSHLPEVPESWAQTNFMPTVRAPGASKQQNDITVVLPRPTPRAPAVTALPVEAERTAARRESSGAEVAAPRRTQQKTGFPASEVATQASPSLQRATLPAQAVPTWLALLAGIYLCGVAALLLQLAAGAAGVLRMLRAAEPVADGPLRREFEGAVAALGIERDVRLLESADTAVPVAWELLQPTVLMPRSAHDWPGERRRVALLHELAHVQRRDCQAQLVAHIALALHWLNPLAWWALHRMRLEREHACDDTVLELGTRASDYADHLLQIARGLLPARAPAWASPAMARTPQLEGRVAAILDPRHERRLPRRKNLMIAFTTALTLLLPLAALQPGIAAQAAGPSPATLATSTTPVTSATPATPVASATPAAQEGQPTVDDLIQMRIHGVSIEFIEEVRDAFGRDVSVRELVQMKIHGTTPEFVAGMQELFGDGITIRDVTNMRIHGASNEFVGEMRDLLDDDLTVRDITNLRIHGATTDFVRDMQELLPDEDLDARDITQMRIHGVTVELVRELRDDGFENLTAHDLVQMKIHGFDRWLQRRRGGR